MATYKKNSDFLVMQCILMYSICLTISYAYILDQILYIDECLLLKR